MMHAILAKLKAMSVKGSHHGLPPRLLSLWLFMAVCRCICPRVTADVVSVRCAVIIAFAVVVGL